MMRTIYTVYILECSDSRLYIGITNNLERRLNEHNEGIHPKSWTARRLPVKLVYSEEFKYVNDAIAREKQIKRWSQEKKRALINSNFEKLSELAKCRNNTTAISRLRSK
jgi:putative endonuclease